MNFFFITGAPRSGTMWFSRFFRGKRAWCYHEALGKILYPDIKTHVEALNDYDSPSGIGLKESQSHKLQTLYPNFKKALLDNVPKEVELLGNSGCGMSSVSLAVADKFPWARFLFVIRNGVDTALSLEGMMARKGEGHPRRHELDIHRQVIKTKLGVNPTTLFEVAVGRWVLYTRSLLTVSEAMLSDRTMVVKFENIFENNNVNLLEEIWVFLLQEKIPFDANYARSKLHLPENVGAHSKPAGGTLQERWHNLDAERQGSFLRIGAKLNERLGYVVD